MISEALIWTIFLLPLGAFVFISLVVRPFFNRYKESAGLLTVLSIGVALALSSWTLQSVITQGELSFAPQEWLTIGPLDVSLGLIVDPLTAIMLVVATGVSLMVQIYSIGYMKDDPGYARYFAIMNLFTASMVGLVMASNIVQMYVFWELVGVCSYLLIGFWFTRPAAAAAAKKAFIVTRIGDFGFLLAILYIFYAGGSLDIASINALEGLPEGLALTWVAAGIFAGAVGKSAQFPLHVWLPDAMEGPTPVSALIHAATMVAAGVFLVARFFPLFEHSADAMSMVAIVGAFTALFAATMGMASYDIKRVMAFSTVSQLGYMIAALGIGGLRRRHIPSLQPCFLQSIAVHGSRQRQPRHRHLRHAVHGRTQEGHALDLLDCAHSVVEPVGDIPLCRVLEQGRDTAPCMARGRFR